MFSRKNMTWTGRILFGGKKEMKKIVSMLAAFAMAAALLVSCSNGSSTPKSEPEAPAGDIVVLDASTLTEAPNGTELVELDGVKYVKVTPDGYNTSFTIPEVSVAGKETLVVTMKTDEDKEGFQAVVKCMDGWTAVCGTNADPTMKPLSATAADYEAALIGDGKKVNNIQPMTQECGGSWAAQSDITIYVSKIIAK